MLDHINYKTAVTGYSLQFPGRKIKTFSGSSNTQPAMRNPNPKTIFKACL